jgi:RNA recognition motif-containing protein
MENPRNGREHNLITVQDLFERIGPVDELHLTYDRAGRSNGVAFVTYQSPQDAKRAIREFDGANAKGISTLGHYILFLTLYRSTYPPHFVTYRALWSSKWCPP